MNVSYITLLNINQLSGLKNIFLLGVSVACTSQLSPFLLINLCWKNPFCLSLCLILGSVYLQWPVDVGSHFSITLNHQSLKTPRGIGWGLWCDYFAPQLLSLPSPICNSSSHVLILRSIRNHTDIYHPMLCFAPHLGIKMGSDRNPIRGVDFTAT